LSNGADEEREEMYEESCRRHAQRRREENRLAWCEYHEDQAARMSAVLEALIGYHNVQAQKYRENGHHQEEDSCSSRSTPKSR
jgi:hypothetical protein